MLLLISSINYYYYYLVENTTTTQYNFRNACASVVVITEQPTKIKLIRSQQCSEKADPTIGVEV